MFVIVVKDQFYSTINVFFVLRCCLDNNKAQQYGQQNAASNLYATPTQINQINQMQQMAAAYSGQPTYFAYAPAAGTTTVPGQATQAQYQQNAYYTPTAANFINQSGQTAAQQLQVVAAAPYG